MKSKHIFYLIMFLASVFWLQTLFIQKVRAATLVVTTTADNGNNTTPTSGSLREAIIIANNIAGADTINFNIPSSDPNCNATTNVCTITPPAQMPDITAPVTINGYSQPGASPNTLASGGTNAVLRIELNGANAGGVFPVGAGLNITGGNTTIKGLVINRFLGVGIRLISTASNNNVIQGNFIGTNATGTAALGNAEGIQFQGSSNNIIGGTTPVDRNLISGNNRHGVRINSTVATGNTIQGNLVGTDANGANASGSIGNGANGVRIEAGSSNNTIGGAATGAGNLIAFNGDNPVFIAQEDKGVFVVDGTGNAIRGNSIHNNVGLGIDLSSDAVITLNDGLDADAGANNLQNFPDLTSASSSGGSTTVQGRFNSAPNATFTIDFYSNTTCNPSTGYGEGQTFIGTASVTTNNRGTMTFSATLPFDTTGQVITSTATDAANNTSEFSGCLAVGALTEIQVTTTDDNGSDGAPTPGSLRAAIRNSNNLGGLKAITFNIPASDPNCNAATNVCTITPPTALQNITAPVIIDGWSQGGANYNGPPLIQLNSSMTINAGSSTVQGLVIPSGITLETFGGNTIRGNYIGTDASGLNRVGNVNGIIINTPENVIGGTNTAHRNIISGSSANGIIIQTLQARGNVIQGNYIGTDKNGANPGNTMGNVNTGILIRISASENIIGGTAAGAGNLIAFNGIGSDAGGILVFSSAGTGNTIRGNSIRDNFGLGIELLGNFGITANDAGDADTGANNLQNFPIITNASTSSGSATISGTLNSLADTQYAIDFYSSLSCDASGNGEGTTYLGSATVTTDNAGNANFNATLPIAPGTQTITSTATLISTGDTSEFSACRTINAPTAATAPLGGQIISEFGQVAKGIVVKLLRISDGTVRETVTNTRGFYRFDDIVTGDTYIITPTRRGFRFLPDNVVYSHVEERFDINFTAVRQRSTSNAISQDD